MSSSSSSSGIFIVGTGGGARGSLVDPALADGEDFNTSAPFPAERVKGRPYAVISEQGFNEATMHHSWFHECFIVPAKAHPGASDVPGARTRYLPNPTLGGINAILNEFAAGAELRDSLRDLKKEVKKLQAHQQMESTDDIVAMTLSEVVKLEMVGSTVSIQGFDSWTHRELLGATVVDRSIGPDVEVLVEQVSPSYDFGKFYSPAEVVLFQPDAEGWDAADLAALWKKVDDLGQGLFIPNPCTDDQFQRFVKLGLQRQRSRRPTKRVASGLKPILQSIEDSTATLQVTAARLGVV